MVLLVVLGLLSVGLSAELIGLKAVKPGEYYNLTDYEALTGKKITEFHESPMLSELAKQGKLPPVEQRLPENPLVVVPYEGIGKYGGVLRRVWKGIADWWCAGRLVFEGLLMMDKTGARPLPNILESLTSDETGQVFTAKIRKGLRWSDGVPVTTEDIKFWYEDVVKNGALNDTIPGWLRDRDFKIEIIDDYTFRFVFKEPFPTFPIRLADEFYTGILVPSHYVKKFLPRYIGEEKAQEIAKEHGYASWDKFVKDFCLGSGDAAKVWVMNPDLPVLLPWKVSKRSTEQLLVLERNPYYFKVDPEGNQLPYIDEVHFAYATEQQMIILKAISGEIDFQGRHFSTNLETFQILKANEQKGGYRVLPVRTTSSIALFFNQEYQDDPVIADILRNVNFRRAISLAINREEIWMLRYGGLIGKPRQSSLVKGAAYYDPEWEKAYAEYDPDRANKLLDEIGLDKRDSEGWRLRPDGKRLEIIIEYYDPANTPELEMVKSYIEAVGVKVLLQQRERSLWFARLESGKIQIGVQGIGAANLLFDGDYSGSLFAPLSYKWYTSGKKEGVGIKPEEGSVLWRFYELRDQIAKVVDPNKRDQLAKELVDLFKENLWFVGWVGETAVPFVVNKNLRNVSEDLLFSFDMLKTPKNFRPEQFYYAK
ncbi:extracellular solute-binding protein [Thermotoga sp. EMP]|nr:extracellular solute-binding protein [Thermotoga sp. EMP]